MRESSLRAELGTYKVRRSRRLLCLTLHLVMVHGPWRLTGRGLINGWARPQPNKVNRGIRFSLVSTHWLGADQRPGTCSQWVLVRLLPMELGEKVALSN